MNHMEVIRYVVEYEGHPYGGKEEQICDSGI